MTTFSQDDINMKVWEFHYVNARKLCLNGELAAAAVLRVGAGIPITCLNLKLRSNWSISFAKPNSTRNVCRAIKSLLN